MNKIRTSVAILPGPANRSHLSLWTALSAVYPIDFDCLEAKACRQLKATVLSDVNPGLQADLAGHHISSLAYGGGSETVATDGVVTFSGNSVLPRCLQNQLMRDPTLIAFAPLGLGDGDEVLAAVAGRPFWIMRPVGKAFVHRVGLPMPELPEGDYIGRQFHPKQWAALLPLLHFLQCLVEDEGWQTPGLRASFMFDDPNLHHTSYGHIDYRYLARDAAEHDYHVSMATVPRDSWYVNRCAASIFREHSDRLSLLIHGNDHLDHEFGRGGNYDLKLRSLAQGLRRIEKLELCTGLNVSRVLVPPHEACVDRTLEAMLTLGYEAACMSAGSLASSARPNTPPAAAGLGVATMAEGGFPVVHRFPFHPYAKTFARLAAFLGQPIIITGHHDVCARGVGRLAALADEINGLGPVTWTDMRGIVRSNFIARREGQLLLIDMRARRIDLEVPGGVTHIQVIRNWIPSARTERLALRGLASCYEGEQAAISEPLPIGPGGRIEVISVPREPTHYGSVKAPPFRPRAIVRRLGCEGRDRISALLRKANAWREGAR